MDCSIKCITCIYLSNLQQEMTNTTSFHCPLLPSPPQHEQQQLGSSQESFNHLFSIELFPLGRGNPVARC